MANQRLAYILWPVFGFGLGGLITGLVGDLMSIGFGVMGLLGCAAVSCAYGSRGSSLILAALVGALGFFLGFNIPFFILLTIWEPPMKFTLTGLFGGALGGLSLGWVLSKKAAFWPTVMGSSIGFGLGMGLFEFIRAPFVMGIAGIIGGIFVGLAAYRNNGKVEL